jgi:SlyX protein
MTDLYDHLANDMIEVQTRLAFQEDTINQLNDVVTRQQSQLDRLAQAVAFLKRQLQELPSGEGPGEEPPPPHY